MRCPLHQGNSHTSLAISEGDGGRVLVKCHGGCDIRKVVEVLGFTMSDLFSNDQERGEGASGSSRKSFEHSNASSKSASSETEKRVRSDMSSLTEGQGAWGEGQEK